MSGAFGTALADPATGYSFVYHLELGLLFVTLIAIGPLVGLHRDIRSPFSNSELEVAKP